MMEISSRIKCLGELYSFASERLRYYQALNKHKGRVDLLSLVESVDETQMRYVRFTWNVSIGVIVNTCRNAWQMPVMNWMI